MILFISLARASSRCEIVKFFNRIIEVHRVLAEDDVLVVLD
jgi:hypothetical protein